MGTVMSPKRIGDPWGEPAALVLDAIKSGSEREKVARYLNSAKRLIIGGYWTDPVTDNPEHRIPYSLITDGTWVWPGPWSWFVDRYGAALPVDLLEHIRALGYQPPELSTERMHEIGIAEGVIPSEDQLAKARAVQAEADARAAAELATWQAAQKGSAQPD